METKPTSPALGFLSGAERALQRVERTLGIAGMATLATLLVVQVFTRFVLNSPVFWIEEVARLVMVWMVFVGIGYVLSIGKHLEVSVLYDRFPPAVKALGDKVILLAVIVGSVPLLAAAWESAARFASIITSASGLPRSVYFIPSVLGYALVIVHGVLMLFAPTNLSETEKHS